MEKGRLSENTCTTCHTGPEPDQLESVKAKYTSMDEFPAGASKDAFEFDAKELPDTVIIGTLADKYPPVKMPHQKIVTTLNKHIENNKMASYFHGSENVTCEGCHHHGSVGRKPALCENCHGKPFQKSDLYRPGLYGAYHRQCLGCHLSMGLQTAENCVICHGKEQKTTNQ
jgi:hypothetical protein